MNRIKFGTEWCLLQNQFDSYEKHSLYIKLLSVIVFLTAGISNVLTIFVVSALVLLWLQDAIWKTFQSRIEARLLQLERYISEGREESEFQFNREYQRGGFSGLSQSRSMSANQFGRLCVFLMPY